MAPRFGKAAWTAGGIVLGLAAPLAAEIQWSLDGFDLSQALPADGLYGVNIGQTDPVAVWAELPDMTAMLEVDPVQVLDSLIRTQPDLIGLDADEIIAALQADRQRLIDYLLDLRGMVVDEDDFVDLPGFGPANGAPALAVSSTCGGAGQPACDHPVWSETLRRAVGMLVMGEASRAAVPQGDGVLFPLDVDVQSEFLGGGRPCADTAAVLERLQDWVRLPVLGKCSGVMVRHPTVGPAYLTARHCVVRRAGGVESSALRSSGGAFIVFDFTEDNVPADRANGFLSLRQVALPDDAKVFVPALPDIDMALVAVPEASLPEGVTLLGLGEAAGVPEFGSEVFSMGFPLGAPLKAVVGPTTVTGSVASYGFTATLDNFPKSSGSPVFDMAQNLVGILSRVDYDGAVDFALLGGCYTPVGFAAADLGADQRPKVVSTANLTGLVALP